MACDEEQLMAYVDGESVSSDFEAHLVNCADCRHQIDQLRRVRGILYHAVTSLAGQDCPRLPEVVRTMCDGLIMSSGLARHADNCPACLFAREELALMEREIDWPSQAAALPPNIAEKVKLLRGRSTKSRLGAALARLGKKITDVTAQPGSTDAAAQAPAAPNDLTESKAETEQQAKRDKDDRDEHED